jgi:hypothetical protein
MPYTSFMGFVFAFVKSGGTERPPEMATDKEENPLVKRRGWHPARERGGRGRREAMAIIFQV